MLTICSIHLVQSSSKNQGDLDSSHTYGGGGEATPCGPTTICVGRVKVPLVLGRRLKEGMNEGEGLVIWYYIIHDIDLGNI